MLSFLKKCLRPKPNPIGADFGSDTIKLAQVARADNDWKLVAAASIDVPAHVRHDMPAKMAFLAQSVRELVAQGGFIGRDAIIALPAASMYIQHLRLPKMDEETLRKSIPWEARGKLPIDPAAAVLRHHVAGEVFQDHEPKDEVIVMAAGRDVVSGYLNMAARAKLDVIGMNVEPRAIVDCFGHVYRRKGDAEMTNCFIDIGFSSTRVVIANGAHILFARSIPSGGDHLSRAVAAALQIDLEQARQIRWRLAASQPASSERQKKQEVESEANPPLVQEAGGDVRVCEPAQQTAAACRSPQAELIERAMLDPLRRLVEEIDFCRRYYEASFPNRPIGRLVFVGGEAKQRWTCQQIAQELGIAAQVGDPLVRMGRISDIGPESGIDRRQPQPNWAVAIGLSMGPVAPSEAEILQTAARTEE
ncbi:MAG: pilus assembly protein PilM [Tepidisphaerales bacterium]